VTIIDTPLTERDLLELVALRWKAEWEGIAAPRTRQVDAGLGYAARNWPWLFDDPALNEASHAKNVPVLRQALRAHAALINQWERDHPDDGVDLVNEHGDRQKLRRDDIRCAAAPALSEHDVAELLAFWKRCPNDAFLPILEQQPPRFTQVGLAAAVATAHEGWLFYEALCLDYDALRRRFLAGEVTDAASLHTAHQQLREQAFAPDTQVAATPAELTEAGAWRVGDRVGWIEVANGSETAQRGHISHIIAYHFDTVAIIALDDGTQCARRLDHLESINTENKRR
jgi:hypothetical protein